MAIDLTKCNEAEREVVRFFAWEHLKPELQDRSKPFAALAEHIIDTVPQNRERLKALDRLLEAKDCAVRAALPPK